MGLFDCGLGWKQVLPFMSPVSRVSGGCSAARSRSSVVSAASIEAGGVSDWRVGSLVVSGVRLILHECKVKRTVCFDVD